MQFTLIGKSDIRVSCHTRPVSFGNESALYHMTNFSVDTAECEMSAELQYTYLCSFDNKILIHGQYAIFRLVDIHVLCDTYL